MKITGTINFEFDDKDLKKRDVEVAGVVMIDMPLPPGLDDVARARALKERQKLHAAGIRQRIKKLEEYLEVGTIGVQILMNIARSKISELRAHLAEVEKPTDPEGQAG